MIDPRQGQGVYGTFMLGFTMVRGRTEISESGILFVNCGLCSNMAWLVTMNRVFLRRSDALYVRGDEKCCSIPEEVEASHDGK